MAAAKPCAGHPSPTPEAESPERLVGIFRTGREVPTIESDKRGEGQAVYFYQTLPKLSWRLSHPCTNFVQVADRHHWRPDRSRRWPTRVDRVTINTNILMDLIKLTGLNRPPILRKRTACRAP